MQISFLTKKYVAVCIFCIKTLISYPPHQGPKADARVAGGYWAACRRLRIHSMRQFSMELAGTYSTVTANVREADCP